MQTPHLFDWVFPLMLCIWGCVLFGLNFAGAYRWLVRRKPPLWWPMIAGPLVAAGMMCFPLAQVQRFFVWPFVIDIGSSILIFAIGGLKAFAIGGFLMKLCACEVKQKEGKALRSVVGWTIASMLFLWLSYNYMYFVLGSDYGQAHWQSEQPTPEHPFKAVRHTGFVGTHTQIAYVIKWGTWMDSRHWLIFNGSFFILWFSICRYRHVLEIRSETREIEEKLDKYDKERSQQARS